MISSADLWPTWLHHLFYITFAGTRNQGCWVQFYLRQKFVYRVHASGSSCQSVSRARFRSTVVPEPWLPAFVFTFQFVFLFLLVFVFEIVFVFVFASVFSSFVFVSCSSFSCTVLPEPQLPAFVAHISRFAASPLSGIFRRCDSIKYLLCQAPFFQELTSNNWLKSCKWKYF